MSAVSQPDTAAPSSLPALIPSSLLYSLESFLNAIAHLVFNLWKVFFFLLAASLCSNSIQDSVAVLHSCLSAHEGFGEPQFLLFSARPVRKVNS